MFPGPTLLAGLNFPSSTLSAVDGAAPYRRNVTMSKSPRHPIGCLAMIAALAAAASAWAAPAYFEIAPGAGPHDVAAAPTPGGPVYYTAQRTGKLGILDPRTG